MRYLVVSDNHGDREILVKLLDKYHANVDYFFHCGDSELRADDELFDVYQVVGGNCDYNPAFSEKQLFEMGASGDKVLLIHGHTKGVSYGMTDLQLAAKEEGANLVFFGHTHQLGCVYHDQTLFLNPGSISFPRGEFAFFDGTYAMVESDEKQLIVQYYQRDFEPISKLRFVYSR